MGGLGSGRPATHTTLDECVVLDISGLFARIGNVAQGGCCTGDIHPSHDWPVSGAMELLIGAARGQIRLRWSPINAQAVSTTYENVIALTSMPQHFGGRQWYFICPLTGKRAKKLYLPFGENAFGCRAAYGLTHAAQREERHYRALRRAFKLRARLRDKGDIGDIVMKPRRMHWKTFHRLLGRLKNTEAIVDAYSGSLERKVAAL